jgi:hypothetical protein
VALLFTGKKMQPPRCGQDQLAGVPFINIDQLNHAAGLIRSWFCHGGRRQRDRRDESVEGEKSPSGAGARRARV